MSSPVPSALVSAPDNVGPARDFATNDDGDLAIVNGDFALIRGAAAVRQSIAIRLRMFLGEYFLDAGVGVPWLQSILIKNPNPLVVTELLKQAIAAAPDVTRVLAAGFTLLSDRTGTVTFKVETSYSTEPLSGTLSVP